MKKYAVLLLLTIISLKIQAQRIEYDVFDNLKYESEEQGYKAYLKKDIFDNLIFSDSNNNELIFKEEYLDLKYENLLEDKEGKIDFFRFTINRYSSERGYEATYDVDIFDQIIIEDNLNNRIEIGTDIFGYPTYEEKNNDVKISVKRNLSGNLEYNSDNEQAFLKKDIFDKWNYSDSSGNKFEFSNSTWNMLKGTYGSEENIFLFLIQNFIHF